MGSSAAIRLNVGSGDKYMPGWVNIDRHGDPDIVSDAFPLPMETDYADEIDAIHLLEHLHRRDSPRALQEWHRVLKRGGKLVIEVPCLDKIAQHIVNGEKNQRLTVLGLFGDPRDKKPDMMHQWCYTQAEITELLTSLNFKDVTIMEPVFHIPARDMRVEAVKA